MSTHAAFNPMATQEPPPQVFGELADEAKKDLEFGTIDLIELGNVSGEECVEALKDVIDPELGINVVDLGLIYGVTIAADNAITVNMTLTSAACPLTDVIERQVQMVLAPFSEDVEVNWVWLPPWGPECITPDGKDQLRAIGFNV